MSETTPVYDFIVVGAGSSGAAVAGRLSESGKHSVLLLEAGPSDHLPWIHVPAGFGRIRLNSAFMWMFDSDPEPNLHGRVLTQPRGRTLGGTSSINGMVFMRGNPRDYDDWASAGCQGWDWASVLPYFRKLEDFDRGADPFHGVGGPMKISTRYHRSGLPERFVDAAVEAGLPRNSDFNGASQQGAGFTQVNTNGRRRWSTAVGYLRPASRHPGLKIETEAFAQRILFEGKRASGVEYRRDGKIVRAAARREIIVSTGSIGSPQLLQVSGIGPAAVLGRIGVEAVQDLPVGQHLRDHFGVRLQYQSARPVTFNDLANSLVRQGLAGLRYALGLDGILNYNGVCAALFACSDPAMDRPDIQISLLNWSVGTTTTEGLKPHPFSGFGFDVLHLHPDAVGHVLAVSQDIAKPPSIQYNFLQSANDIAAMTFGVQLGRRIAAQQALSPFVVREVQPGDAVSSNDEIAEDLRQRGTSDLHPCGTCRMGPRDGASVVDARLRVHGIEGLRVADCSVMPKVTSGNTNAPAIMIGEKAAAMILEDAAAQ